MDKFEYKVIEQYYIFNFKDFLDNEGKDGWELIQIINDPASFSGLKYHYYFKRKIVNNESKTDKKELGNS